MLQDYPCKEAWISEVLTWNSGVGTQAGDIAIKNSVPRQILSYATKPWSHTMGYISVLTHTHKNEVKKKSATVYYHYSYSSKFTAATC